MTRQNDNNIAPEKLVFGAAKAAFVAYVCGCAFILMVLGAKGFQVHALGSVAFFMVAFLGIPLVVAGVTAELVHRFLRQRYLPLALFVQICSVLNALARSWDG